jgi:hypothetical protein
MGIISKVGFLPRSTLECQGRFATLEAIEIIGVFGLSKVGFCQGRFATLEAIEIIEDSEVAKVLPPNGGPVAALLGAPLACPVARITKIEFQKIHGGIALFVPMPAGIRAANDSQNLSRPRQQSRHAGRSKPRYRRAERYPAPPIGPRLLSLGRWRAF